MKLSKELNKKNMLLLVVVLYFIFMFSWLHFSGYTIYKNYSEGIVISALAQVLINEDISRGLRGIDSNSNGIRDDIDRLIARDFSQTQTIKKAAEQKALALQAMLEAGNKTEVFAAVEKLSRAGACVYKVLPERTSEQQKLRRSISRKIESLTANTRVRLDKYLYSNKLASGGYFPDPPEPVCN